MKIRNLKTGTVQDWTIEQMLAEINRDRSDDWTPYTQEDFLQGWDEWVEGDYYSRFSDSYKVTFTGIFHGNSEEDAYDNLIAYLRDVVTYQDVTPFSFEESQDAAPEPLNP